MPDVWYKEGYEYCPGESSDFEDVPWNDSAEWRNVERKTMVAKKKTAPKAAKKTEKKNPTPGRASEKDFLARQRKELENAKKGGSREFWRPGEGKSVVRFFSFEHKGQTELFLKDTRHWSVDGNQKTHVGCRGDDCPICNLKEEIGDKLFSKVRAQSKYLANVVVRKADGSNDKQAIASLPRSVYKDVLGYVTGELDEDVVDCLNLETGTDFRIIRAGKGLETKYTVVPMPAPTPIGMEVKPVDLHDKIKKAPTEEEAQLIADGIREMK